MWLNALFQGLIEGMAWEKTLKPVRILYTIVVSVVFFVGIASMFLLTFLVEGQSPIMRGVWLVLGIGMLVYYLRLVKTVVVQMRTTE